ncbi:MAG: class I SAM-dependent methyltransferase [Ignavibacteria bacterium]|nr:class I SAM-dependent methyltransferase [Ignavibacteria bacterium]
MTEDILLKHREVWKKKKILREIYEEWYRMIISDLSSAEGPTVELGAGGGNFKEYYPKALSADIEKRDWLDMSFDAHEMPFQDQSVANLVMIDVLHHLADPVRFLHEASRVLKTDGRLIMLEPYPSLFSRVVYKMFHPEPFIYDIDYFSYEPDLEKHPWESNQAIPYLLFYKRYERFKEEFGADFVILKKERLSFLVYPASGGFENRALFPDFAVPVLKAGEQLLRPLGNLFAFRCYLVLNKTRRKTY